MLGISGLFEAHLTVRDLAGSLAFYREVVGLEVAHVVEERGAAFLWVGEAGRGMIGLWSIGTAPLGLRLHVAFAAPLTAVLAAPARLRERGVTPLGFDGQPAEEACVLAWMPAASVYFSDPDGHSLELLAMLPEPPRAELGVVPYSVWRGA